MNPKIIALDQAITKLKGMVAELERDKLKLMIAEVEKDEVCNTAYTCREEE